MTNRANEWRILCLITNEVIRARITDIDGKQTEYDAFQYKKEAKLAIKHIVSFYNDQLQQFLDSLNPDDPCYSPRFTISNYRPLSIEEFEPVKLTKTKAKEED